MSLTRAWWTWWLVLCVACGGGNAGTDANEPQTAKEKQLREAKASGELSGGDAKKWGVWRYSGDRKQCFYVLGRRCFKTEKAACKAANCRGKKKCDVVGGGPATIRCR